MPSVETSPETAREGVDPVDSVADADAADVGAPLGADGRAGFVDLIRSLAEDTRTLVQQEIELVRLEVAHSARRIATDSAWIGAGAVTLTVGLVTLALALALGIGELLGSYWLGALITAGAFLLVGALFAWRGVRDLKRGDLLPTGPVESLREDRDWARRELDDLKKGLTEDDA